MGKKLHTYVYHIVYNLGNCEALHEITDLVHQMLSVCAPLEMQALKSVRISNK